MALGGSEGRARLTAPFPYFGGKRRVAGIVWRRFGRDIGNYVEPFAGSLAVLLARPGWREKDAAKYLETINDIDRNIANAWRAIAFAPEQVIEYANWPINEADIHARANWIVTTGRDRISKLESDPEYFDAKIAGWWIWGKCVTIANAFDTNQKSMPSMAQGIGIKRTIFADVEALKAYFKRLSTRLKRVRVCCGNWDRPLGYSSTTMYGPTAVFLDPPYVSEDMSEVYVHDSTSVGRDCVAWALKNGDDKNMRIAVCGYEGEYEFPDTWTVVKWKAAGGYGNQGGADTQGKKNAKKERIWFSPHCLGVPEQPRLFEEPPEPVVQGAAVEVEDDEQEVTASADSGGGASFEFGALAKEGDGNVG